MNVDMNIGHEYTIMTRQVAIGLRPICVRLSAMFGLVVRLSLFAGLALCVFQPAPAAAQELKYPQIIQYRYEATDPAKGGHFLLWVEREKIWYGLDPRLFPAAKSVEVTHVTPGAASSTITTVAVTLINGTTPDYFHLSGNVRFKVNGMAIKSTNAPRIAP